MENNHCIEKARYDLGAGNYPGAAYQIRDALAIGEDIILHTDGLADHDHAAFLLALASMRLDAFYDGHWLVIERPVYP